MQKIPADNIKSDPLDKRRLFEFYLMRPLAFLPTIVFYRIKVSPDTVTWMGFIIQVLAAAGYIFAPIEYSIILAVIFNVSFIFDHIDGNLAGFIRLLTSGENTLMVVQAKLAKGL